MTLQRRARRLDRTPIDLEDTIPDSTPTLARLVADGTVDAELGALLWLLVEDGVPLIVAGEVETTARVGVARAILETDAHRPWVVLDADADPPDADSLGATLRGGVTPAITLRSGSLRAVLDRLSCPPAGLPEDAVRRLGVALILDGRAEPGSRPRVIAAHYLRPTQRDGQGHLQRRPPAVLATWDAAEERFEHFAWGITSELADRVDRSQDDFERRQATRAAFLAELALKDQADTRDRLAAHLAGEPARQRAPDREAARGSAPGARPPEAHLH